MTDTKLDDAAVDPAQLFDDASDDDTAPIETDERTYTHETPDHCEADALGRAIVGVTDADGNVLLVVNHDEEHAILPNGVVDPDEDWETVARRQLTEAAGLDVPLDRVERVRRVEHVVDADADANAAAEPEHPPRTTHHVVFATSVESVQPPLDGLCDDNPWTLGWYDEVPVAVEDDGSGVLDDIELFGRDGDGSDPLGRTAPTRSE